MNSKISFVLIAILSISACFNAVANTSQDIDTMLESLKKYEWGQSTAPFDKIDDYMRASQSDASAIAVLEEKLTALLESGQLSIAAKDIVCRKLAKIATEKSLSVLTNMTTSEDINDVNVALVALRGIDAKLVNEALRGNLASAESVETKVALANTLGQNKDSQSVETLASLIGQADQLDYAVYNALGKIASQEAADVLLSKSDDINPELTEVYYNALLAAADSLLKSGNNELANKLYTTVYKSADSELLKYASLKGQANAMPEKAEELALAQINKDTLEFRLLLDAIRKSFSEEIFELVSDEYDTMPIEKKIQIINAYADNGSVKSLNFLSDALKTDVQDVRLEAIKALLKVPDTSSVLTLAKIAADSADIEKETAQNTLYSIPGEDIDAKILEMLDSTEGEAQLELIKSAGMRNMTSSTSKLMELAKSKHRKVSNESLKSLKIAVDPAYTDQLLDMLVESKGASARKAVEKVIVAALIKDKKRTEKVSGIHAQWAKVDDNNIKKSLMTIIGSVGDDSSLPVLTGALKDAEMSTQYAAVSALSEWPNDKPASVLLDIAKNSEDKKKRILSLRGYIKLIGLPSERPVDETVDIYINAMSLTETVAEKRMILSGLSSTKSYKAFLWVADYLDDETLKSEAEVAVVHLGWWVRGTGDKEKMREVVKKVVDNTTNQSLKDEANNLLSQI